MRSLGLLTQLLVVTLTSQLLLAAPVSETSANTGMSLSIGAAPGIVSLSQPPTDQMKGTLEKRMPKGDKASKEIRVNGRPAGEAGAAARDVHASGGRYVEVNVKGEPNRLFATEGTTEDGLAETVVRAVEDLGKKA